MRSLAYHGKGLIPYALSRSQREFVDEATGEHFDSLEPEVNIN